MEIEMSNVEYGLRPRGPKLIGRRLLASFSWFTRRLIDLIVFVVVVVIVVVILILAEDSIRVIPSFFANKFTRFFFLSVV